MGKPEVGRRAIFLDRDGVLVLPIIRAGLPFSASSSEEFELYEDAAEGCRLLKDAGFVLVVVTNQPEVGRGTLQRDQVEAMHRKLLQEIPTIDRIEVCYHAGAEHGEACECRKPKPGMLLQAADSLGIDLSQSYLIGDRWRDIDCARAAGCRCVFIDRHYAEPLRMTPDAKATGFAESVAQILEWSREIPSR